MIHKEYGRHNEFVYSHEPRCGVRSSRMTPARTTNNWSLVTCVRCLNIKLRTDRLIRLAAK